MKQKVDSLFFICCSEYFHRQRWHATWKERNNCVQFSSLNVVIYINTSENHTIIIGFGKKSAHVQCEHINKFRFFSAVQRDFSGWFSSSFFFCFLLIGFNFDVHTNATYLHPFASRYLSARKRRTKCANTTSTAHGTELKKWPHQLKPKLMIIFSSSNSSQYLF